MGVLAPTHHLLPLETHMVLMYACRTTHTLIQEVESPPFVQLSRGVGAEVTGAHVCVEAQAHTRPTIPSMESLVINMRQSLLLMYF